MSIPFSTFVNVTSSTLTPSATFGRLNALCITPVDTTPEKDFEEFATAADVVGRYGVGSSAANYAAEFFSYSSKSATTPQKLTFYNWRNKPIPYTIMGATITDISLIKKSGSFRTKYNNAVKDITCDLSNAVNLVDAATIIAEALQTAYPSMGLNIIYSDVDNAFKFTMQSSGNFEFIADEQEVYDIFTDGTINSAGATISPSIDINEAGSFTFKADEITSTSSGSATLKVLLNDEIEVFKQEVNNVKNTSIQSASFTAQREEASELECTSLSVSPEGYTFNNVNITYTQNAVTDLSTLCGLTVDTGAIITSTVPAITIEEAINKIGLNNGDYVTIGLDANAQALIDISENIDVIMQTVNIYALNRYYFIGLFTDTQIAQLVAEEQWNVIKSYEGLIAIRGTNANLVPFVQAIIASIDFAVANGAMNINFIDATTFINDAINTASELTQANDNRVNTVYNTGGYGQTLTFFGEGHIMGDTFKTLSVALGETYIKAQLEVQGISILNGANLISLRGKSGQGQVLAVFSSILSNAVTSGIIVQGATLTAAEKAIAISATGIADIPDLLETNGWYIQLDEITDEHIANKTIPVTFVYVANIPTNRIQARSFLIGA